METCTVLFDGIPLIAPVLNGFPIAFPWEKYDKVPTYCGAGQGLGDRIVPDYFYGICISLACYIHDEDWFLAEPTEEAFNETNDRLVINTTSIIRVKSPRDRYYYSRLHRCVTYGQMVHTFGKSIFWGIKNDQFKQELEKFYMPPNIWLDGPFVGG